MEPKPHPGKDGDARTCLGPHTGRTKHHPAWDPPVMGFPQCFGGFPLFSEKTLISVTPSQALCSDIGKEEKQGKETPSPYFLKAGGAALTLQTSRLVNPAAKS